MNNPNLQNVISSAEELLRKNPIDAGHDLSHHERVAELAEKIVSNESLKEQVDKDVLEVACMWHDVNLPKEKLKKTLKELLSKNRFKEEFILKVLLVIDEHEFEKEQTVIESKLIYDADKLDALSIERGRRISDAILNGDMSEAKRNMYIRIGKIWLKKMRGNLHFEYSRKQYDERLEKLFASEEVRSRAQKLDIDLDEIRMISGKDLSFVERVVMKVIGVVRKFK